MATYKELLAKKQELDAEIENARRAEAAHALNQIRETIETFGFGPEDVFGMRRKGKAPTRAPQFRNSETGETWSGRGPRPRWLKGKDPEEFRIKS